MANFRWLLQPLSLILRAPQAGKALQYFGHVARRYRNNFYVLLALVFLVAIGVNTAFSLYAKELDTATLDLALKRRLSSPAPSDKIVILDVDEKSLEAMAKDHGRWPWPREVLAEALAKLSEAEVSAVAFNIMLSDPDIRNKASDDTFNDIAKESAQVVFPMIRLNPENDKLSQVRLGMIKGATGAPADLDKTVAVLFPAFSGTHDKLGLVNLDAGKDGVIRQYRLHTAEGKAQLPSMVAKVAALVPGYQQSQASAAGNDRIILNWRNKRGSYERISFSDFFQADGPAQDKLLKRLSGKVVVLGVSAPGIANVKPTPYSLATDDNLIMATAIDDVLSDTHLKILSPLLQALFAFAFIGALCWGFYSAANDKLIQTFFLLSQTAFAAVTVISISYTSQLFDLTLAFMFGTAYFIVAKVYAGVEKNAYRGNKVFAKAGVSQGSVCHVLCLEFGSPSDKQVRVFRGEIEKAVGINNVFHLDNVFGKGNFVGNLSDKFDFFVVFDAKAVLATSPGKEVCENTVYIASAQTEALQRNGFAQSFSCSEAPDAASLNQRVARAMLLLAHHAMAYPNEPLANQTHT